VVSACGGGSGPIQIGVAANFTDPLSLPIRYGAQLAAEEINAAGGVNGRPIELVEREDYADTDSAVVVATDFYNSPVVAVIGHGFSGPTRPRLPGSNTRMISPSTLTARGIQTQSPNACVIRSAMLVLPLPG